MSRPTSRKYPPRVPSNPHRALSQSKRAHPQRPRLSTAADLEQIHQWVTAAARSRAERHFLTHWDLTVRAHHERNLIVYPAAETAFPIAYEWGRLVEPGGHLQVHPDYRRQRIGSVIVQHRITQAHSHDDELLYVPCRPTSSIPFWIKNGFALHRLSPSKTFAYRTLARSLACPPGGKPVAATIRFLPNSVKHGASPVAPLSTTTTTALAYPNGIVRLPERVHFFSRLYPAADEVLIEIQINDAILCQAPTQSDEAASAGVFRCRSLNGYYIDRIATALRGIRSA